MESQRQSKKYKVQLFLYFLNGLIDKKNEIKFLIFTKQNALSHTWQYCIHLTQHQEMFKEIKKKKKKNKWNFMKALGFSSFF